MEKILVEKREELRFIAISLLSALFIAFSAWVKIPFYPVPFTLHTFAIFLLALTQTPKQVLGSTLCYLILGTCGLPVFSGGTNFLWFMGKCGGFLVAFPISAYIVSKLKNKIVGLAIGQLVVYLLGFIWLTQFFGPRIALMNGILLFVPSDTLKALIAYGLTKDWKRVC